MRPYQCPSLPIVVDDNRTNCWRLLAIVYFQSLARIAESHIVIAPSKHQMIVNPVSGKRERIYVNLEAVYPTPEEPGTELSFEELWAANRGWLDANWDDESIVEDRQPPADENVDLLSKRVATKLVVHHDVVTLDENGAIQEPRKSSKPKKKKMAEVNETQISQPYPVSSLPCFC